MSDIIEDMVPFLCKKKYSARAITERGAALRVYIMVAVKSP